MRTLVIMILLGGCGAEVSCYEDGAVPPLDGSETLADGAGQGSDGASLSEDAGDAPTLERYACDPYRTPGTISHNDCRRYADRPICDAISKRCVPLPTALCGACETDEQCRNVDLQARCVYMPNDAPQNADSACLVPCDDGCDWIQSAYEWSTHAMCSAQPTGNFCAPEWGGKFHCRNPDGTRQGT